MNSSRSSRALPAAALLALAIGAALPAVAADAGHARLPAGARAAAQAAGVQILADYGRFLWVRGDQQTLAGLGAESSGDDLATYGLTLGGRHFDPAEAYPLAAATFGRDAQPALRLIQFQGPLKREWLDALRAQGVEPVQYLPPFTYVVWARGADLQTAAARSEVRWAGEFLAEWRVGASLAAPRGGARDVLALLYRPAAVGDEAFAMAGVVPDGRAPIDARFEEIRLRGDDAALARSLTIPGLYAVHEVPTDGGLRGEVGDAIVAGLFNESGVPQTGQYRNWLTALGIDGSGVIMANVDGGVADTNPNLVNRMLPCVTGASCGNASTTDSHGTHTAATMAGDGSSGTVANGYLRGLGVAPGANLIEQISRSSIYNAPGGMLQLMRESYNNNAVLSGNSWGPSGSPLGYDNQTMQVDVGSRDTDPNTPGDQPLTFVLSIMNGNGGTGSQGTPDDAKNIVTVGSTWAENAAGVPRSNLGSISSNSAHGPARDGRRIPHLVAPGCNIDSAVSATGYGTMCGTSMASPHVSGAIGLFTQYYRERYAGANPSVAVAKAALLAHSQDLFGGTDADGGALGHRPDNKQGWGRMRIDWLLEDDPPTWYYDQAHVFHDTGEEWEQVVEVIDPGQPVKVFLTFTDAPGHGLGGATPAWNNDLDLVVTANGQTYRGNVFGSDGWSTTGGSADARNNAEGVLLPAGVAGGQVTITVGATTISSRALLNAPETTSQDFAIACVNCRVGAAPEPEAMLFKNGFEWDLGPSPDQGD